MAAEIPKWEAELWSYVSSGDGEHCPLRSQCGTKLACGWCISDNTELLDRLLDSNQFSPSNYDFVKWVTPGRIFVLVEKLTKSFLRKGQVHCPPVPTEIVSLFDEGHPIEVRLVPLRIHRGAVWYLKDGWVIYLNENDPHSRRRLSLFHEAFHILAHCKATPVFRKMESAVGSFNELLAEYFATCILMPREWIDRNWEEVKDIHTMAEIFDVTENTMWVRLRSLRLV